VRSTIKPAALTGLVFILAIISCGTKEKKQESPQQGGANRPPATMQVDGFIVKQKPLSDNVEVPGNLIANESTEIHPEISGRVVQLNVGEGRYVTRGTLLAKLYDGDLQAQLKKLQVQLQIAKQNEDRSSQLLKIQGISQQDYDASLLNVNNINADIEIIRTSIIKTEIRAPFNGKVGLKNISIGAVVTPATIVATIQQTDILKLDFAVPEKYTAQIKAGQQVSFSIEGSPKKYTAKIMATESGVTENTRSLMIRSVVQNKDAALAPGVFAKVVMSFDPDPNAIVIPTQAVLPQARGKKVIVYQGGVAKFMDVTTGLRDSSQIQIVTGLKAGDTIITTGLLSIRPEGKIAVSRIIN
jgi:membrane fusion protein, multidrug efflux system